MDPLWAAEPELRRLTSAIVVLFGEERDGAVVQRGARAERVRLARKQLLTFLQPQLLVMHPLLDEEYLRHLDALLITALNP